MLHRTYPIAFNWRSCTIMAKQITILVIMLLLVSCANNSSPEKTTTITLLHTNDTHSHIESFTPFGEPQQGGAARRKTMIEAIRDEVGQDRVLLVDSGDFFQGTTFFSAWKGAADIMVLNELGYDAVTLGNHEFDFGAAKLGRTIAGASVQIATTTYPTEALSVPIVSTNLDFSAEPAMIGKTQSSIIVEKSGEQIAIIGVDTPKLRDISLCGTTVEVMDYIPSVQTEVDNLTAQGIDKIVLLSHAGYRVDYTMVNQLSGVDVVVCAHDHPLMLPESSYAEGAPLHYLAAEVVADYPSIASDAQGNTVLLVGAYEWGKLLGRIDITFDEEGHVIEWSGEPIAISADIDADSELEAKIAQYKEPINAFTSEIIGSTGHYFDGERDPGLRSKEMALGTLVSDTIRKAGATYDDNVVAAIINGGAIRSGLPASAESDDLPPYDVTFGDALSVLPFGNTITIIDVSGTQLVAALDNGLTWAFDYENMTYRSSGAFPQISGLQLTYCGATVTDMRNEVMPPAPCPAAIIAGGVVTTLHIGDDEVDLGSTYRIATNNFIATGGDYYLSLQQACKRSDGYCVDTGILALDALVDEFKSSAVVIGSDEEHIVAQ